MSFNVVLRPSYQDIQFNDQFGYVYVPQVVGSVGASYEINENMSVSLTGDALLPIDPAAEGVGLGLTGTFRYEKFFGDASWARYYNDDTFSVGGRYQVWEGLSLGARFGWIQGNNQNPLSYITDDDYTPPPPRKDFLWGAVIAYDLYL